MVRLESSSDSGHPGFWLGVRSGPLFGRPGATLFRDDRFIRILNQLLQTELGAAQTYRLLARNGISLGHDLYDSHRYAARQLVNLIVANRGLPEENSLSLPAELSAALVRISRLMPGRMGQKAAVSGCEAVESWLLERYRAAIRLSRNGSKAPLGELAQETIEHLRLLREHSPVTPEK